MEKKVWGLGSNQVKFRFLISSIFDAMNFQHFQKMLENSNYIKDPRNQKSTFDLSWTQMLKFIQKIL